MKILYICDEYPPGKTGGIGSVIANLAKGLAASGHQIFVVGLYAHGFGGKDVEEHGNISIRRFRYVTDIGLISDKDNLKDKIILHALRRSGILKADASFRLKQMFRYIRKLIDDHGIDIIEMPDWNNFYFNTSLNSMRLPDFGIPLTVKMHGTLSYFNKEQGLPVSNKMFSKEQSVFLRADALSSVSAYTAQFCKTLYHLSKDIRILHNSVELRNYIPVAERSNSNRVIFTGSLFKKKGVYSLIKSWKDVIEQLPDATLHVYGKGNAGLLKSLLDEKSSKSVFFYGHVGHEELIRQLEQADLAVFPSYTETFGLGVVEAMSTGCPAIYTKRSCGPEIVEDHKEGLLVDPDQPGEIASAILRILKDQPLRTKLSKGGYEKVKTHFERQKNLQDHLRYYEEVINLFQLRRAGR